MVIASVTNTLPRISFTCLSYLQMLHTVVRQKLNRLLTKEMEQVVGPMRKRISELQNSNEWWKNLAVKLQKQITDLSIIHQRNEYKKSTTNKVG